MNAPVRLCGGSWGGGVVPPVGDSEGAVIRQLSNLLAGRDLAQMRRWVVALLYIAVAFSLVVVLLAVIDQSKMPSRLWLRVGVLSMASLLISQIAVNLLTIRIFVYRKRCGVCLYCAYPMAECEDDRCTECGQRQVSPVFTGLGVQLKSTGNEDDVALKTDENHASSQSTGRTRRRDPD